MHAMLYRKETVFPPKNRTDGMQMRKAMYAQRATLTMPLTKVCSRKSGVPNFPSGVRGHGQVCDSGILGVS
jgi:hypothetical protein